MTRRYLSAAAYRELANEQTEHDLLVLKRVSDLRFVSGSQLTRLCFAGSGDNDANGRAAEVVP
jgi:hypothetical protein